MGRICLGRCLRGRKARVGMTCTPVAPITDYKLTKGMETNNENGDMDVTTLCREAAKALGPNEMIHDPDFSLYGAMSALELMDAKMDKAPPALESLESRMASGALPTNLDTAVPSIADEVHDDIDTQPRTSSSQRALSVLDGMTICEVAWHEGGSLPETLYACLYLHPAVFSAILANLGWELPSVVVGGVPSMLDLKIKKGTFAWKPVDRALTLAVLAQSLATLRCGSIARDVIMMADIFEEEDFYPNTFGFRLSPPVEDESLSDLLELAKEALRERIRTHVSKTETGVNCSSPSLAEECILAHLEARKEFLHAFFALRDAFMNKRRERRLKALAQLRAERAQSSGDKPTGSGSEKSSGLVGINKEVVAAADGLAAMTLDRPAETACPRDRERSDRCEGEKNGTAGDGEASSGVACSTSEGEKVGLVVEGKAVGKEPVLAAASENARDNEETEDCKDRETLLRGIARCEGHLHAAVAAFDALLIVEASSSTKRDPGNDDLAPLPSPASGNLAERSKGVEPGDHSGATVVKSTSVKLGDAAGRFAFEEEMNRHLLGSSPHHHVHFRRNRGDAIRALKCLAREAEHACGVVDCDDLSEARRYLLWFSHVPAEGVDQTKKGHVVGTASLFARSLAAVCLYRQELVLGRFNPMLFAAEAMTDVGVPNAVVQSPAGQAFLERVGKPVFETLRVLCLNRARQRISLEVQLQDWRTLQAYADTVDDAFQMQYGLGSATQRYMAKWALSEVLGLMHRYLQIGIELQLPSCHEWAATYWYWDYVMTTKLMTDASLLEAKEQLEAIKAQIEEERLAPKNAQLPAEAEASAAMTPPTGSGGSTGKKGARKKKRGNKKKADPAGAGPGMSSGAGGGGSGAAGGATGPRREDGSGSAVKRDRQDSVVGSRKTEREKRWLARREWETAEMKLRQCLCRGAVRLLAGLQSLGIMGQGAGQGADFRFTTPSIIHRERFRAFQALETPMFQTYETFLAAVEFSNHDAPNVVDAAAECFGTARTMASDQLRRLDSLVKEAKTSAADAAGEDSPVRTWKRLSGSGAFGNFVGCSGWSIERADLMALKKLAVSNAVAATQVLRSVQGVGGRASATTGGRDRVKARARLDFGAHDEFPVVKVSFD